MSGNNNESQDQLIQENLQKIKYKIVVLSGKGGVGKSTVSVNLAYSLALNGYKVGIMDVDIHGPSIAKMTGIESKAITTSEGKRPGPIKVVNNLYALTIASMLGSPDDPIIWRGPLKIGVIKQFLSDIEWPELDFLIIDFPPGTGDEALTTIQLINDVTGALVVSTPQDVAFLDARKSINFCKKMNVPILGIIENMSTFICPHCGEEVDIFKTGGAEKAAKDFEVDVLGKIPIDSNIAYSADEGKPYIYDFNKSKAAVEFSNVVEKIVKKVEKKQK